MSTNGISLLEPHASGNVVACDDEKSSGALPDEIVSEEPANNRNSLGVLPDDDAIYDTLLDDEIAEVPPIAEEQASPEETAIAEQSGGVDLNPQSVSPPIAQPRNKPAPPLPRYDEIQAARFLATLSRDSPGVFEIRAFRARFNFQGRGVVPSDNFSSTIAGYFDDINAAINELDRLTGVSAFVTINPANPELLARADNKFRKLNHTTTDDDILCVRWLYLDIDPKRPADVSSTDEELARAVAKRDAILAAHPEFVPSAMWGKSGNGAWILVRLTDFAPAEGRDHVSAALAWLGQKFSDDETSIDPAVKNPARICGIPGTLKCKGDHVANRPHRLATLDSTDRELVPLDLATWLKDKKVEVEDRATPTGRTARQGEFEGRSEAISQAAEPQSKTEQAEIKARAIAYVEKMDLAISGEQGSKKLIRAAIQVGPGFNLPKETAYWILATHYNPRCIPPWDDSDLLRAVNRAYIIEKDRGFKLRRAVNEGVEDPHRLARLYRDNSCLHSDGLTLRNYRSEWMKWDGSAYHPILEKEIRADFTTLCKSEFDRVNILDIKKWLVRGKKNMAGKTCPPPEARWVTTALVTNVTQAMIGFSILDGRGDAPFWILDNPEFPAHEVVPFQNLLLHLPTMKTHEPTPRFFCTYALNYDYDPNAPEPAEWLSFLRNIWGDDQASINTLQEWFGYCLTPDTSQQKILTLVGVTRSGKGTIGRVLTGMLGKPNVAAPSLAALGEQFGQACLIGKPLAIIGDAHLPGNADKVRIIETLKSISGEDTIAIPVKHRPDSTGKLPTRFLLLANEIPDFADQSTALAGRMIFLSLTRSFQGQEDPQLTSKLLRELPGILLWAIEGWKRLQTRGHFVQPASGHPLKSNMADHSAPLGRFVAERCRLDPKANVPTEDLRQAFETYCLDRDIDPGFNIKDCSTFGRALKKAAPSVCNQPARVPQSGDRYRAYHGICLVPIESEAPVIAV